MHTEAPHALKENHASLEIGEYYDNILKRAKEVQDEVKIHKDISSFPILDDLHNVIDIGLSDRLYEYAMCASIDNAGIPSHTVKVTFMSLKIGKGMGYDETRLLEVGLGAFLENVGIYKIPDRILQKKGKLTQEEMALVKEHPQKSHEILARMGDRFRWLAEVALQVHERVDGSGYPRCLKADEILEFASIIGLADTYVALTSNRSYRKRLLHTDAVKFIVKEARGLFPLGILKTFFNEIAFFPVGSHVILNSGSIGQVVSTEKNQPLLPKVKLLYDGCGKQIKNDVLIRLIESPILHIVECIEESEPL